MTCSSGNVLFNTNHSSEKWVKFTASCTKHTTWKMYFSHPSQSDLTYSITLLFVCLSHMLSISHVSTRNIDSCSVFFFFFFPFSSSQHLNLISNIIKEKSSRSETWETFKKKIHCLNVKMCSLYRKANTQTAIFTLPFAISNLGPRLEIKLIEIMECFHDYFKIPTFDEKS